MVFIALAGIGVSQAEDQDVIDYRKHVMKTMGEQVVIINMIMQQRAPAANLATHIQILAVTATTAQKVFEPRVLGGGSKAEVWANWPDFSKRLDDLVWATVDLGKTSQTGRVGATALNLESALKCKSCHDTYMTVVK
jgi:cytochrome c556